MISPTSVFPPMNFLNQLPDFNEIPWRDHANKGDFHGIFLNLLAITIQK